MSDSAQALPTLRTERLTLVALTPEAYAAWAAGDAKALAAATGIPFVDAAAPPLLSEDLPKIRDMASASWDAEAFGWWGWLATLTETGGASGAYAYLPASVRAFPDQKRLAALMETAGFRDVRYRNLSGGIAAMHVAAKHPEYFLSATAFPGYLWQPTEAKLRKLEGICAYFYVGEHDEYRWHGEMRREAEFLSSHGSVAQFSEEKGQPHRIETLAGPGASRLFDGFEAARRGCTRRP